MEGKVRANLGGNKKKDFPRSCSAGREGEKGNGKKKKGRQKKKKNLGGGGKKKILPSQSTFPRVLLGSQLATTK